jgi:cell division protein FtsB
MNALRPSPTPLRSVGSPQRRISRHTLPRRQRHPRHAVVVEVAAKFAVNMVLTIAAIATLIKLVPYHVSQEQKLQELRAEVKATKDRVDQLQTDFNRYFDPSQTERIMQEQSNRINPNQIQIIWSTAPDYQE